MRRLFSLTVSGVGCLLASVLPALAQSGKAPPAPPPQPVLQSLRQVPVPVPSNLDQFIANRAAAIQLGKALFWDMQVGSDGVTACATCHFHAGADNRIKNQVSPGLLRVDANGNPNPDSTFQVGGPNYTFKASDFPFHKLKNINDASSTVISDRNDVASSQGVFSRDFVGLDANDQEINRPVYDPVFHIGSINTRRVEPRNSPTTINAVFNLRNFWDGRAQDVFNGVNPFGLRDRGAQVYVSQGAQQVRAVAIEIDNASLASQAVGPPLSAFEMSSAGKQFPDLGRRLLGERPLADQLVHSDDSVLGSLSRGNLPGLSVPDYATLIRLAFKPQWWESQAEISLDPADGNSAGTAHANASASLAAAVKPHGGNQPAGTTYSQMEANFSLFFGLSVQLYESLLVSDQTPYDSYAEGNSGALTATQKQGLDIFLNKGKCVACHKNAEFTGATVQNAQNARLERMLMGDGQNAVYDNGFYNIGVRPTLEDLGVGGKDPFGLPLSEARLLSQFGGSFFEQVIGSSPGLTLSAGERTTANGAFKTPGLRNIELTAPYFHNGGQRTLAEVVDFYNRGGDFARQNIADLDPDVVPLGLTTKEKDALVQFLKALTDERVRYRKAPFDHPQLWLPNGHVGGTSGVTDNGSGEAVDQMLELPPTGRNGGTPLPSFLQ